VDIECSRLPLQSFTFCPHSLCVCVRACVSVYCAVGRVTQFEFQASAHPKSKRRRGTFKINRSVFKPKSLHIWALPDCWPEVCMRLGGPAIGHFQQGCLWFSSVLQRMTSPGPIPVAMHAADAALPQCLPDFFPPLHTDNSPLPPLHTDNSPLPQTEKRSSTHRFTLPSMKRTSRHDMGTRRSLKPLQR
jgi:hypothetical protein